MYVYAGRFVFLFSFVGRVALEHVREFAYIWKRFGLVVVSFLEMFYGTSSGDYKQ